MTAQQADRTDPIPATRWRGAAMLAMLVTAALFGLGLVASVLELVIDPNLSVVGIAANVALCALLGALPLVGAWLLRRGRLRGYAIGIVVPLLLTALDVIPRALGKARSPEGAWEWGSTIGLTLILGVIVVAWVSDLAARRRPAGVPPG